MFTKTRAVNALREVVFDEYDPETDAIGVMADYLDATADYYNHDRLGAYPSERQFLAELAAAFQEGYEHAVGEHARGLSLARRVAGLSV